MTTYAQDIQIGDELLMPDGFTWCEVCAIKRSGAELFVEFEPAGFSCLRVDETVKVRPEPRDTAQRLKNTQAIIESALWGLVQSPLMHASDLSVAVRLLDTYRWVRHLLMGTPRDALPNWIRWYAKEYPEVPGSTRDMVAGIAHKWPNRDEHMQRFTEEATRALLELEGMRPPQKDPSP